MSAFSARSAAPPERVWELIAWPERWREWSPYVRGARGLGSPEVEAGAVGSVLVRGGLRVTATITAVRPGESWSWRVGGLELDHSVEAEGTGSRVELRARGNDVPWSLAAVGYSPALALIVRRIARVAQ